jgi:hypothetical protein
MVGGTCGEQRDKTDPLPVTRPFLPGQPRLFAKGVQLAVTDGDKEGVGGGGHTNST